MLVVVDGDEVVLNTAAVVPMGSFACCNGGGKITILSVRWRIFIRATLVYISFARRSAAFMSAANASCTPCNRKFETRSKSSPETEQPESLTAPSTSSAETWFSPGDRPDRNHSPLRRRLSKYSEDDFWGHCSLALTTVGPTQHHEVLPPAC